MIRVQPLLQPVFRAVLAAAIPPPANGRAANRCLYLGGRRGSRRGMLWFCVCSVWTCCAAEAGAAKLPLTGTLCVSEPWLPNSLMTVSVAVKLPVVGNVCTTPGTKAGGLPSEKVH